MIKHTITQAVSLSTRLYLPDVLDAAKARELPRNARLGCTLISPQGESFERVGTLAYLQADSKSSGLMLDALPNDQEPIGWEIRIPI